MSREVFICHSSEDKQIANAICHHVEAAGVRCWIAPRDVRPGANWDEEIVDAIESCRAMVFIFTENANESPHVLDELHNAATNGLTIVPVRLADVLPSKALKLMLSRRHWLDAMTPPLESHLKRIANEVSSLLGITDNDSPPDAEPASDRHINVESSGEKKVSQSESQTSQGVRLAAATAFGAVALGAILWGSGLLGTRKSADDHFLQGKLYEGLGENDAAIREYQKAISLDPEQAHYHQWLGAMLVAQGEDYPRAITVLDQAIALGESQSGVDLDSYYHWRGKAHFDSQALDAYEKAFCDFKEARDLNPEYATNHYWLGRARVALGKNTEAINDLREAVKLDPEDAYNQHELGVRLAEHGSSEEDKREAVSALTEAITLGKKLDGYDRVASDYFWRGRARITLGEHQESVEDFRNAVKRDPSDVYYQHWLGSQLSQHGLTNADLEQAVIALTESIRLSREQSLDVTLDHYWRGRAHFALNDFVAAIEDFEVANGLDPENSDISEWLERARAATAH